MKSLLAFGFGALTVFGSLSLLSLVMFLRQVSDETLSGQLLVVASLLGPALGISCICAASYWLGLTVNPVARHPILMQSASCAVAWCMPAWSCCTWLGWSFRRLLTFSLQRCLHRSFVCSRRHGSRLQGADYLPKRTARVGSR